MKDEHFSCFFPNFGWFWFPVELIEPGRRVTTQRQAAWWDLSSWGMKRERNLGCECACSRSFSHMCNMYIITIIINNYNDYIYIYYKMYMDIVSILPKGISLSILFVLDCVAFSCRSWRHALEPPFFHIAGEIHRSFTPSQGGPVLLAPSGKRRPPMGRTLLGHWNDALKKLGMSTPALMVGCRLYLYKTL